MKKRHEQSVIDAFSKYMERRASDFGRQVTRCSLDGQDTVLGADYLFTNHTKILMVEFKYEKSDIEHEVRKWRRLKLCQLLDVEEGWRSLSLECHYVAWSEAKEINSFRRGVNFNAYYSEVCNQYIFGQESGLVETHPNNGPMLEAKHLVEDFFSGNIGTDFVTFERYTDWLLSLEDNGESGIELIVDHPDGGELLMMEFTSVGDLKNWLDSTNYEPPKPKSKPKPGGFSGPGMG
ncbi:hypothetical protein BLX41_31375 [Pseudomonas protegens]|uniref:hypothetical protein n=1 Tax=Pseudomonas protegens TaxID=380021 RepID=UPI000F4C80BF|nr:hypothetical protein [Pseudomonas protegens]ROL62600.1 hypothetical protein BLX41_31375 [Pseudomonas protegens]